jgi:hypothetical protein
LLYSSIAAILLRVGVPSASRLGMWQSWQVFGVAPAPEGRGCSPSRPLR